MIVFEEEEEKKTQKIIQSTRFVFRLATELTLSRKISALIVTVMKICGIQCQNEFVVCPRQTDYLIILLMFPPMLSQVGKTRWQIDLWIWTRRSTQEKTRQIVGWIVTLVVLVAHLIQKHRLDPPCTQPRRGSTSQWPPVDLPYTRLRHLLRFPGVVSEGVVREPPPLESYDLNLTKSQLGKESASGILLWEIIVKIVSTL